ncbi:YqzL family protein [Virgibacillus xinjiangensis]|uniref:YqzL family protein n=1 Tax=Virgibacillus xinjiangensis TaxID=393090 RepID=A0ABV7CRR3_9BACI
MIDTWKFFSQTGNIETYLLMKELENTSSSDDWQQSENEEATTEETNV